MMDYVELRTLVNKSLDRLSKVKKVGLTLCDFVEDIYDSDYFNINFVDENGWYATTRFSEEEITGPLEEGEPKNASKENLLILRIAKRLWEAYKKRIELANVSSSVSNISNGQTVSGVAPFNGTVTTLKMGNATYSICDSRVDALDGKLKDLEQKNQDLEDELIALKKELQNKDAMIKAIWDTMTDKGMF